jgi:hypothetical protein
MLVILCVTRAQQVYPFAMSLVVILNLCLFSCIYAICSDTYMADFIQNGFVALSVIFYILLIFKWPAGDDGPGMMLWLFVGPLILLNMILGLLSSIRILLKEE